MLKGEMGFCNAIFLTEWKRKQKFASSEDFMSS